MHRQKESKTGFTNTRLLGLVAVFLTVMIMESLDLVVFWKKYSKLKYSASVVF